MMMTGDNNEDIACHRLSRETQKYNICAFKYHAQGFAEPQKTTTAAHWIGVSSATLCSLNRTSTAEYELLSRMCVLIKTLKTKKTQSPSWWPIRNRLTCSCVEYVLTVVCLAANALPEDGWRLSGLLHGKPIRQTGDYIRSILYILHKRQMFSGAPKFSPISFHRLQSGGTFFTVAFRWCFGTLVCVDICVCFGRGRDETQRVPSHRFVSTVERPKITFVPGRWCARITRVNCCTMLCLPATVYYFFAMRCTYLVCGPRALACAEFWWYDFSNFYFRLRVLSDINADEHIGRPLSFIIFGTFAPWSNHREGDSRMNYSPATSATGCNYPKLAHRNDDPCVYGIDSVFMGLCLQ